MHPSKMTRRLNPIRVTPSPMERSYRLVATGRRVTLAEWMDAISEGHIPSSTRICLTRKTLLMRKKNSWTLEPFDDSLRVPTSRTAIPIGTTRTSLWIAGFSPRRKKLLVRI